MAVMLSATPPSPRPSICVAFSALPGELLEPDKGSHGSKYHLSGAQTLRRICGPFLKLRQTKAYVYMRLLFSVLPADSVRVNRIRCTVLNEMHMTIHR